MPCLTCGAPSQGKTRCPVHTVTKTAARGYGARHQARRKADQVRVDKGGVTCWRCGCPLSGTAWHEGHDDHDRTQYRGPECVRCNDGTALRP